METRGERRAAKQRKYGKHRHKTDGAGVRMLQSVILNKAAAAAKEEEARDSNPRR